MGGCEGLGFGFRINCCWSLNVRIRWCKAKRELKACSLFLSHAFMLELINFYAGDYGVVSEEGKHEIPPKLP